MKNLTIVVENPTGLHARPAAQLVQCASKFRSQVTLMRTDGKGKKVNAKSILAVLNLGASQGTEITIDVQGDDEDEAILTLKELIESFKE